MAPVPPTLLTLQILLESTTFAAACTSRHDAITRWCFFITFAYFELRFALQAIKPASQLRS